MKECGCNVEQRECNMDPLHFNLKIVGTDPHFYTQNVDVKLTFNI